MIFRNKARISGLIFIYFLCFYSCTSSQKEVQEFIFQYPNDLLWRGIPLQPDHDLYKKNCLPSPVDSILYNVKKISGFNYYAGIQESEIPELLIKLKQQQLFNYAFLRNLGVPMDKEGRENLKYLNLTARGLTHTPPEIALLKGLLDLQLSDNNIRSIGPQLFFCRNLRKLDLSSNIVDHIPTEIAYLANLEELILRDNRLTALPANFSQLKKLKILDLSNMHTRLSKGYNNFSYIPPSVCHLPHLEKLLLEKLPIQVIPVNIVFLKNLKVLSLNGCYNLNVYNALRILSNMEQLQVLDISFTGTRRVPNEIVNLKNLKVLIWQEEGNYNKEEIERIKALMPETRIYSGNETRPFFKI
jgi:hypothetical protein